MIKPTSVAFSYKLCFIFTHLFDVKIWNVKIVYPWICLLKELACYFTTIITRLKQRCIFYDKLNFASVQTRIFRDISELLLVLLLLLLSFVPWWGLAFMLNFKCKFLRECSLCVFVEEKFMGFCVSLLLNTARFFCTLIHNFLFLFLFCFFFIFSWFHHISITWKFLFMS